MDLPNTWISMKGAKLYNPEPTSCSWSLTAVESQNKDSEIVANQVFWIKADSSQGKNQIMELQAKGIFFTLFSN